MKGVKVQVNDINVKNNFDMVRLILKIISVTKSLHLSETELYALTYFVINGYSKVSREDLITNKLLKNKSSVNNLVHEFRKYGIIVKNAMGEQISSDFNIPVTDCDIVKLELLVKKQ
jgi:hypothetical protein